MTRKISKYSISYTNNSNHFHQEGDKPSTIYFDGFIFFRKNNKLDRKGKPSIINPNGTLVYYENDKFVKRIKP